VTPPSTIAAMPAASHTRAVVTGGVGGQDWLRR
jgi:hypothetical protein